MSSYLQKYHLQKVEPVKNRPKNYQHDLNKFKPKTDKINSVKIPLKAKHTLHKNYFDKEEHKNILQTPKT